LRDHAGRSIAWLLKRAGCENMRYRSEGPVGDGGRRGGGSGLWKEKVKNFKDI